MARNGLKAVLFDISGTLIDDFDLVVQTDDIFLRRRGKSMSRQFYIDNYTLDWKKFWEDLGFPPSKELVDEWVEINKSLISEGKYDLHPAVIKLLAKAKKSYKTAAVTSMSRATLLAHLKRGDIPPHFFDFLSTGELDVPLKPAPDQILLTLENLKVRPQEAVMIGDTDEDVVAGKRAGTKTIKVSWGYPVTSYGRRFLASKVRGSKIKQEVFAEPDHVVSSFEQLKNWLQI